MHTDKTHKTTEARSGQDTSALLAPHIRLNGTVNDEMLASFLDQLDIALEKDGLIAVQVTTPGGDADIGRRIADEIRLCREHKQRDMVFIGVSNLYSAGVTIMGAFPRQQRYLRQNTVLLIHGRKIKDEKIPAGPLTSALQFARIKVSEFENGLRLQRLEFEMLIEGSDISIKELEERAATDWYVDAADALRMKLIAGTI